MLEESQNVVISIKMQLLDHVVMTLLRVVGREHLSSSQVGRGRHFFENHCVKTTLN